MSATDERVRDPQFAEFTTTDLGPDTRLHHARLTRLKTVLVKVLIRFDLKPVDATRLALLRTVMRRGTRALPTQREIVRFLESLYGAGFGTDVAKIGESHVLGLRLETVADRYAGARNGGPGLLEKGLAFLRDALCDLARENGGDALRTDTVAQERTNLRRFIEGLKDDRETYAAERCIREMCRDEPYSVYEYGDVADLDAIDGADLAGFLARGVATHPMDIYVTGPIERAEAEERVRAALDFPRTGGATLRGTTPNPPPREERTVVETLELKQAKLFLGYRSDIRYGDERFLDLLVMNGVLGGFIHSKLFRNVREEAGLCYYATSYVERTKGLLFIASAVDPDKHEAALDLIRAQLEAIRRGEVSDDELEATRAMLQNGYRGVQDEPDRLVQIDYVMDLNGRDDGVADLVDRIGRVDRDGVVAAAQAVRPDTVFLLTSPDGGGAS